ncbi:MAG TPA: DUF1003 domain-containing protein [Oculatellaceae cyanobacterium]|jgi:uncharacterized membrane protein
MKPTQSAQNVADTEQQTESLTKAELKKLPPKPSEKTATLGQRVADAMAARVGSWAFLIGQTTVLAGWVGCNLTPGMPHWDEQPFILLNLVFSFASAYTAPIVLMSQNRQSDVEREDAAYNHQVNLKTAHDLELLHKKIDELHELRSIKLEGLTQMLQQQQGNEIKITVSPAPVAGSNGKSPNLNEPSVLLPAVFSPLPIVNEKTQEEFFNQTDNNQYSASSSLYSTNLLISAYVNQNQPKA